MRKTFFVPKKKPNPIAGTKTVLSTGDIADSKTEASFFEVLKAFSEKFKVPFEYQVKIDLTGESMPKDPKMPLLRDRGAPKITMTVDFKVKWGGITYYLDTKGSKKSTRDSSRLRYNLLKHKIKAFKQTACIKFIYAEQVERLCLIGRSCIAKGRMAQFFIELDEIENF